MNRKHEDLYTIHTEQNLMSFMASFLQVSHTLETFLATNRTIHITITIVCKLLRNSIVVNIIHSLWYIQQLLAYLSLVHIMLHNLMT